MEILIKLQDVFTGEERTVTIFDMTSPNDGYTQKYIETAAADYARDRAPEQFDGFAWDVVSVELIRAKA